jgi:4-amino-4-deoxy-L-arabinose transferase-like glycosyltransferase
MTDTDDPRGEPRAGAPLEAGEAGEADISPSPESGEDAEHLLPPGNPPRYLRGLALLLGGGVAALVLMAVRTQARFGVPLGALFVLVATAGALDLLGSFDDPDDRVAHRTTLAALAPSLALLVGASGALFVLLTLAVAGHLGVGLAATLVPAAFLATVVGLYRVGDRLGVWSVDADGAPLPLLRRHGFWLVALTTLLYLPMLGSHSLSDPWETHYGEVAREILARDDWISLWWAQDGWFWSKPVLAFWIQALAMASLGVRYQPGEMLSALGEGRTPWPEWAVRFPIFLLTLLAGYLLYKAVARTHGRRAGLCGGVVLATMPQWFLLSHQTMTDMPFVATMAAAMALFLLGLEADPEQPVRVYEVALGGARVRLSGFHLVLGAIVACALPQILYLVSRNLQIRSAPFDLAIVADAFSSGSPGNCGLPGNEACRAQGPVSRGLAPALEGLLWLQSLGVVLYVSWGERRVQRLYFLAAWFFAALSMMAKGLGGVGLPVLAALGYLVVTRRYRDLLRMEILPGALVVLVVAMPWFFAMLVRHGQPFLDRLVFHDMYKRAFTHVHDTNEGDDVSFRFYVWQLGYATFPWIGLAPAALVRWLRRGDEADPRRDHAAVLLATWFLVAFALFSWMPTKFHHYILPALPPAAMLVGVLLDDMTARLERAPSIAARADRMLLGAIAVGGALLVLLVGRDLALSFEGRPSQVRLWHLVTYNYKRPWPPSIDFARWLWGFTVAAAVALALAASPRLRRWAAGALVAVALAFAAWAIDVYLVKTSPHWGQRENVAAYYRAARDEPGTLVAYQMNWKGENFYTGNRLPTFVSSGKKFTQWIDDEKKKGAKVFYFLTEHGRTGTLANELGSPRAFDKLTTPEQNNKFVLVRVRFE